MSHQGRVAVAEPVGGLAATPRQPDVAPPRGRPVAPIPPVAKLFAEPGSAPVRMFGQEPMHLPDVLGAPFPSLHHHDACQGSHGAA
jgi:hypothetical protein